MFQFRSSASRVSIGEISVYAADLPHRSRNVADQEWFVPNRVTEGAWLPGRHANVLHNQLRNQMRKTEPTHS